MPLIKHEECREAVWALWEIVETESDLCNLAALTTEEKKELTPIKHDLKRKEYLAGRLVVKTLVEKKDGFFNGIYKDSCGKPHLVSSNNHISLSHSFPYAGAILHPRYPSGIDIERIQEKLIKIAPKFLSAEEKANAGADMRKLCIYWCAKETLYKIYGRKHVIFHQDLLVSSFDPAQEGVIEGKINLPDYKQSYQLQYIQHRDHIICFNK